MCCALNHSLLTLPLVTFVYLLFLISCSTFYNIIILIINAFDIVLQDIGNQPIAEISVEEGKDVKLSCTLKKISDASSHYWYRQASRNAPVYILYSIAAKDYLSSDFQDRFSSKVNKTNEDFELSIVTLRGLRRTICWSYSLMVRTISSQAGKRMAHRYPG
uniref:Immunoglobulin V-set domain-containing protein n=1 Tax=Callorhinchus milii TaxID=7868 RepID=A0A4W3GN04_CALMI